jgi:hypothetical protein
VDVQVELADLAGIDDSLLASLTWVLHNSIEGVLFETFTVPASSSSSIGQSVTVNAEKANEEDLVELCPGGRHIDVCTNFMQLYEDNNKKEKFPLSLHKCCERYISAFA